MPKSRRNRKHRSRKISHVEVTADRLTSRGGLSPFVRYLEKTGILPALEERFGLIRKSAKGLPVISLFKQLFCFFLDGTSRHLVYFDHLAKDDGYAAAIEAAQEEMASSHQVKRFFRAFRQGDLFRFRALLRELCLWRMKLKTPEVILLGLDSMVLKNHEAKRREGVEYTYKKVCGFHPLQLTWGRFLIDAEFRRGSVHCNNGNGAFEMIAGMVGAIRERGINRPIIVRLDSGFFDHEIMEQLEAIGVGYLMGGRLSDSILERVSEIPEEHWVHYSNGQSAWRCVDYLTFRDKWKTDDGNRQYRRMIYSRTEAKDGQFELPLDETTESVIYTNLSMGTPFAKALEEAGLEHYLETERLLEVYHERGADELIHRRLKDFASQTLPFRRFTMNAALYYVMLVAFFLYECFKEDVCSDVVKLTSYPTTLRRRMIDVAAKIVRGGNAIVLKVTRAAWEALDFGRLWERANSPPQFA